MEYSFINRFRPAWRGGCWGCNSEKNAKTFRVTYNFSLNLCYSFKLKPETLKLSVIYYSWCWQVRPSVCPSVRLSVCENISGHLQLNCPSVAYTANNSRTRRPSVPKFGMKVPHLRCDSSFKVERSKVKVTRPVNADTHPVAYLPIRTYRVPLVGVFLGHFRINLHQAGMQYSNEGPQYCNWAKFSKIAF